MKLLIVICFVSTTLALPQGLPELAGQPATLADAGILRMENIQNEDNSFRYSFETSNNIIQEVSGQQKEIGETSGTVMQGSYSYITKDENGQDVPVEVRWIADENGFRAEGDVIPVAPESIVPAVPLARSIALAEDQAEDQAEADAAAAEVDEVTVVAPPVPEDVEGSGKKEDEDEENEV